MAELKTKPTEQSVADFLAAIPNEQQRADSQALAALMGVASGAAPRMWGPSIVGFGDYRYSYASGRSGDWFVVGFSPRAQNLALYLMGGLGEQGALLERLGKHKTGKGCLYIKRLADVDQAVLRAMIEQSVAQARAQQ